MAMIGGCWHDVPGSHDWPFICESDDITINILNLSLKRQPYFTFDAGSKSNVIPCRLRASVDDSEIAQVNIWKQDDKGVYHKVRVILAVKTYRKYVFLF